MTALHLLVAELASIACAVSAGFIAYAERPGWGWFLLVSVLLAVSASNIAPSDANRNRKETL